MFGQKNSSELHTWVEERLSEYIDNQLAPNERGRVERHLIDCAQCRASFESLRWTVSLVKHAPAPVTKRSFTLAVPPQRQPSFAFGFARLATALATLLLFAVIGVDLITQFGSAPTARQAETAAQEVALAQTPTASIEKMIAPTLAPEPSPAPKPAGAMPAVPPAPSAPTPSVGFRSSEVAPTQPAADAAAKANDATQSARQPALGSGAPITQTIPATATIAPTQTATTMPTPPTMIAQASEATPVPLQPTTTQPLVTPLRFAEIALLFLAIFFGTLMLLLRGRTR